MYTCESSPLENVHSKKGKGTIQSWKNLLSSIVYSIESKTWVCKNVCGSIWLNECTKLNSMQDKMFPQLHIYFLKSWLHVCTCTRVYTNLYSLFLLSWLITMFIIYLASIKVSKLSQFSDNIGHTDSYTSNSFKGRRDGTEWFNLMLPYMRIVFATCSYKINVCMTSNARKHVGFRIGLAIYS